MHTTVRNTIGWAMITIVELTIPVLAIGRFHLDRMMHLQRKKQKNWKIQLAFRWEDWICYLDRQGWQPGINLLNLTNRKKKKLEEIWSACYVLVVRGF